MSDKKNKYITKQVEFGGNEITLYSLDGMTWSTRRGELHVIKDRQEKEKVSFAAVKDDSGETKVIAKGEDEQEEAVLPEIEEDTFEDLEFDAKVTEAKPAVVDFLSDIPMLKMVNRPKEKSKASAKAAKAAKAAKGAEKARKVKQEVAKRTPEKIKAKPAAKKAKPKLPAKSQKAKGSGKSSAAKKKTAKVAPKKRASSKPAAKSKVKAKGKRRAA